MKTVLSISVAALLAVGISQASLAQGRGNDKGEGGPDKGRGSDRVEQGQAQPNKGKGAAKGQVDRPGKPQQAEARQADRGQGQGKPDKDRDRADRNAGPARIVERDDDGPRIRGVERDRDGRDRILVFGPYSERGLIAGCPPGLAKRNNGCLPPGQERKLAQARYDGLWGWRDDDYRYRYDSGYLYRFDRQGGLLGYLPLLGGALAIGNPWPEQYRYDPAPNYYSRYYRLNDPYDYRYADGAIYGVDPQTQAIRQVVALLTGQPISVGQPMPSGYDVYNVPYDYRDRYYDTPDRMYRYNDGYVYQVDPTTRLVQAVIELLL